MLYKDTPETCLQSPNRSTHVHTFSERYTVNSLTVFRFKVDSDKLFQSALETTIVCLTRSFADFGARDGAGDGSLFFVADFGLFFAVLATFFALPLVFFFAAGVAAVTFWDPLTLEDFSALPKSFGVFTTTGSAGGSIPTAAGAAVFSSCVVKAAAASVNATTCVCNVS